MAAATETLPETDSEIKKIYPTEEELSLKPGSPHIFITCPETNCTATFKSQPNLSLHLAKHHNNTETATLLAKKSEKCLYFCPVETCPYNQSLYYKDSFDNLKNLRQHYQKVHTTKSYFCCKCNSGFSLENLKNSHEEYCGVNFVCPICGTQYSSYETLMTHARRKNHKIFSKKYYKTYRLPKQSIYLLVLEEHPPLATNVKHPFILPKSMLDVSTNADPAQTSSEIVENVAKRKRKKKSSETQTHKFKAIKSSAGTQTEVVSVHHTTSDNTSSNLVKKSIKTQTATRVTNTRACNTSFDMSIDLNLNSWIDDVDVQKTSFGTQTLSPNIFSTSTTSETQRETETNTHADEDLLGYHYINDTDSDSNFCNTNMETQTDWFTDLDLLSNDVYSNNYTQTCDEILPPDLQFNNTHTQTVFNDILRSVGSQTNMRLNGGVFMANNETQTDLIFKELLQEINS